MHTPSDEARPCPYIREYFSYLAKLFEEVEETALCAMMTALVAARRTGATVFIAGNGGSASTATHFANDLCALSLKNAGGSLPLRTLALSDNTALLTAIGNDDGYERIFVDQLRIHYRPGDVLVTISASGNSPNILEAARYVRDMGGMVISLIGFDGGQLAALSDIPVIVRTPPGAYGPVEDMHVVLCHLVAGWLRTECTGNR